MTTTINEITKNNNRITQQHAKKLNQKIRVGFPMTALLDLVLMEEEQRNGELVGGGCCRYIDSPQSPVVKEGRNEGRKERSVACSPLFYYPLPKLPNAGAAEWASFPPPPIRFRRSTAPNRVIGVWRNSFAFWGPCAAPEETTIP